MYARDMLFSMKDLGGVLEVPDLPIACSDPRGRSLTTKLLSTPRAPWLSLCVGQRHVVSTGWLLVGGFDVTDLPLTDPDLGGRSLATTHATGHTAKPLCELETHSLHHGIACGWF